MTNFNNFSDQQSFFELFMQAPFGFAIMRGEELIFDAVNNRYLDIIYKTEEEIIGKPLLEVLPEIKGQQYVETLKNILKTGKAYKATNQLVVLNKNGNLMPSYVDFTYHPLIEKDNIVNRILVIVIDVTEQVLARKRIEDSERKFFYLIKDAPSATALYVGREMRVEIANDAMLKLWGKDESILGKTLKEGLPELDGQVFLNLLDNVYTSGETYHTSEGRADLMTNGILETFYFNYTYKPVRDEKGEVYGVLNMAVDVTEQVLAKLKLAENEERLRISLKAADLGTFDWHLDTNELDWDKRAREMYSLPDDLKASYQEVFLNIINQQDRLLVEKAVEQSMLKDSDGNIDVEYRATGVEDNITRWIKATGKTIFSFDDKPSRIIGTLQDVTKIKNEQKRKDEFMGVVAHELRTPVTSLKAFAQFLLRKTEVGGDEKSAQLLQKMEKQIDRLNLLIQDLLDVTKVEEGKIQLREDEYDFVNLLNEIVEQMQSTTSKKLIVENNIESASIFGDRDRIGQVLINLISNAVKYAPGEEPVQINLSIKNNQINCSVKDKGIGISKENQKNIFERYYRAVESHSDTFPGLGLGLYISAEIIKRQNGKISVESEKDKGAEFTFSIPLIKRD